MSGLCHRGRDSGTEFLSNFLCSLLGLASGTVHDHLQDVMDLIFSEVDIEANPQSSSVLAPTPSDILSTVTVSPYVQDPPSSSFALHREGRLPSLRITEQPKQRGMRFRYQCEGRSAGSILGANSTENNKTAPEIEIINCEDYKEVSVTVCLVWKDSPYRVHPHSLVGKDCQYGICQLTLLPQDGIAKHSFSNLGIQCVKKREVEAAVNDRLKLNIDPYNAGKWRLHEEVDLNVVRLCFQVSCTTEKGKVTKIPPVLSQPIYDKKSTNTSELKIWRMNRECGRCEGGEEIYILCDKVQKEDIQVIFVDNKWEGRADFSQADVHRQIAIVVKTPPYRDLHITEPAHVQVFLQRITDGIRSEGVSFVYMPEKDPNGVHSKRRHDLLHTCNISDPDPHGIERKRKKMKPNYTEHYDSSYTDYNAPLLDSVHSNENYNGFPISSPDDGSFYVQPPVEDFLNHPLHLPPDPFQPTDLGIYSDYLFDTYNPGYTNGATAQLVASSLTLTEEEPNLPDCVFDGLGR
ncbi:hypothetical protein GDO86_016624 [Hymenochirus boettgeri]|uniref:RHD domain-containing protein n=1 Tax=Hymenochirus boettgeri TaxID=247094 RepID=A0A8T2K617_9PIPI|nr:hypothetical protein GDO86_016624 [Hymenochirus boettgeri]